MKNYILISVVNREITVQTFQTYEEAYQAMKKEVKNIYILDNGDDTDFCDGEPYYYGIDKYSAFFDTENNDYDWLIQKL